MLSFTGIYSHFLNTGFIDLCFLKNVIFISNLTHPWPRISFLQGMQCFVPIHFMLQLWKKGEKDSGTGRRWHGIIATEGPCIIIFSTFHELFPFCISVLFHNWKSSIVLQIHFQVEEFNSIRCFPIEFYTFLSWNAHEHVYCSDCCHILFNWFFSSFQNIRCKAITNVYSDIYLNDILEYPKNNSILVFLTCMCQNVRFWHVC